jgi:predicted DNA-binding ribbon-helix-helix protein
MVAPLALATSPIEKRSVVIGGRKTSISLEAPFWEALKSIAAARPATLSVLMTSINLERQGANLSSAIRLFVLNHYRTAVAGDSVKPVPE